MNERLEHQRPLSCLLFVHRLHFLLAAVAGIMSMISLNELLPVAIRHCGAYASIFACGAGMLVCQVFLSAADLLGD